MFASLFIANLGSLEMDAGHHQPFRRVIARPGSFRALHRQ